MAMPIGASSNAERKRSSLSREDSRASSFMRQETMLTMPSALMNSGVDARPSATGARCAAWCEKTVFGVERAHQPVVHEHVQEREQVREPLLVRREQRDHHEEVEVRLDAAVPQVHEHRRGGQQREADGGRAAVARQLAGGRRASAKTATGTISIGGAPQRLARDEREEQQRGDVRPRDRGHRTVALESSSRGGSVSPRGRRLRQAVMVVTGVTSSVIDRCIRTLTDCRVGLVSNADKGRTRPGR